jgi:hypothetical protein
MAKKRKKGIPNAKKGLDHRFGHGAKLAEPAIGFVTARRRIIKALML